MWNWLAKVGELQAESRPFVLITVSRCQGSTPREVGAKMIYASGDRIFGTIGGGRLEELAITDAKRLLHEEKSDVINYPLAAKTGQCCGGSVDILFEVQNAGPRLYIFGAGHVGQALCQVMVDTPFQIHLIDERDEWLEHPSLSPSIIRHSEGWDYLINQFPWSSERSYAAIMTHRHDLDQDILEQLLKKPLRYLGLIGSQAKWARFKQRLTEKGISEAEFCRVDCPMGLDIGGKAPKEVAISLAAKLIADHYGKKL